MTLAAMRRLVVAVFVAGALCAPATAARAQVPAPPPGIGAKLLEGPADSLDNPRAHEYVIDHVAPGTTISRKIGFSNGNSQPADLTFYAAASEIHDGAFVPGAGHATNDLTTWTTFAPTSATVPPGQTVSVTVTIAVPVDARRGERYAAALAEHASAPAAGGGVASVSRVGIRIYLSVGPGGEPTTAFSIDSMTALRDADGYPLVATQVHNTGERAIDLAGDLELTNGPSSLSAGPFAVRTASTLKSGDVGTVTVALDRRLPSGPWDARITLTSGVTSESGTARLTFPIDNGANAAPITVLRQDATQSAFPEAAIGIAVVILIVLIGSVTARRRRRRARALPLRADAWAVAGL
ncbi:MAG: hypothetical protein QOD39_820 [Mycobacterium sp.]|nr:hypothetical protein [Mycobacterium sp.]